MVQRLVEKELPSSAALAAVSMVMLCCCAKFLMMVIIDLHLLKDFHFFIFPPFLTPHFRLKDFHFFYLPSFFDTPFSLQACESRVCLVEPKMETFQTLHSIVFHAFSIKNTQSTGSVYHLKRAIWNDGNNYDRIGSMSLLGKLIVH
jgi:hypothetical protein